MRGGKRNKERRRRKFARVPGKGRKEKRILVTREQERGREIKQEMEVSLYYKRTRFTKSRLRDKDWC